MRRSSQRRRKDATWLNCAVRPRPVTASARRDLRGFDRVVERAAVVQAVVTLVRLVALLRLARRVRLDARERRRARAYRPVPRRAPPSPWQPRSSWGASGRARRRAVPRPWRARRPRRAARRRDRASRDAWRSSQARRANPVSAPGCRPWPRVHRPRCRPHPRSEKGVACRGLLRELGVVRHLACAGRRGRRASALRGPWRAQIAVEGRPSASFRGRFFDLVAAGSAAWVRPRWRQGRARERGPRRTRCVPR